mmetsp:Transcript_37971/g.59090  ORF Transcript_37971/g.59090 Transcript_37971/m.59090 type:complete len:88 (+) Transcript_37971:307-570(+)
MANPNIRRKLASRPNLAFFSITCIKLTPSAQNTANKKRQKTDDSKKKTNLKDNEAVVAVRPTEDLKPNFATLNPSFPRTFQKMRNPT